jgi:hypothetical protein
MNTWAKSLPGLTPSYMVCFDTPTIKNSIRRGWSLSANNVRDQSVFFLIRKASSGFISKNETNPCKIF